MVLEYRALLDEALCDPEVGARDRQLAFREFQSALDRYRSWVVEHETPLWEEQPEPAPVVQNDS